MVWSGVPPADVHRWAQAFARPSRGHAVAGACPCCGSATLNRYYAAGRSLPPDAPQRPSFVAHGALWEWCSTCRLYEHASALVPVWWDDDLHLDTTTLTAVPDELDAAAQQAGREHVRDSLLLTVEDAFLILGRGLVVEPGPHLDQIEGGTHQVELRLPDGSAKRATAIIQYAFPLPTPTVRRWTVVLQTVDKAAVPGGTVIWLASDKPEAA